MVWTSPSLFLLPTDFFARVPPAFANAFRTCNRHGDLLIAIRLCTHSVIEMFIHIYGKLHLAACLFVFPLPVPAVIDTVLSPKIDVTPRSFDCFPCHHSFFVVGHSSWDPGSMCVVCWSLSIIRHVKNIFHANRPLPRKTLSKCFAITISFARRFHWTLTAIVLLPEHYHFRLRFIKSTWQCWSISSLRFDKHIGTSRWFFITRLWSYAQPTTAPKWRSPSPSAQDHCC